MELAQKSFKIQEMVYFVTKRFPKYGGKERIEGMRKTSLKIINCLEEGYGNPNQIASYHLFNKALLETELLGKQINDARAEGVLGLMGYELISLNLDQFKQSLKTQLVKIRRMQII